MGTDGFTASIDGCLEGVKKESWRYRVSETEREREMERRVCSVDDSLIA